MTSEPLLIVGASTRAAAFSALRAGLGPTCIDLFGDADLRERCPVTVIPRQQYPYGLVELAATRPSSEPLMYTGGLENHPEVIAAIMRQRALWGNPPDVLKRVRDPGQFAEYLAAAGFRMPEVRFDRDRVPADGAWLVKPLAASGGRQVHHYHGERATRPKPSGVYYQRHVKGDSVAPVYVGDGGRSRLLGVSRQLTGRTWLHAKPFAYCGSIGPLPLPAYLAGRFEALGQALVNAFGLRGLFGVDCVMHEDEPWVIEVNPRYTASIEILEYAQKNPALGWHRESCSADLPRIGPEAQIARSTVLVGKAIVFARQDLIFPSTGPWLQSLSKSKVVEEVPAFADIPHAGAAIRQGWPIMTLLVEASSPEACERELEYRARALDRYLLGR